MQRKTVVYLCLLFSVIFLVSGYSVGKRDPTFYQNGYNHGYETGYDEGYDSGYECGQDDKETELSEFKYTSKNMTQQYRKGYAAGYDDAAAAYKRASSQSTSSQSTSTEKSTYTSTPKQETTVYITNTGSKYHRSWCQYLRQSCIAISLSDAKAQGYTACSKCW